MRVNNLLIIKFFTNHSEFIKIKYSRLHVTGISNYEFEFKFVNKTIFLSI